MKHGHISRSYAKAFFAFVTIGMAGACAESTVAPSETPAVAAFQAPAAYSKSAGVQVFRVNNNEGITQRLGNHIINIPAGAICDPAKSSYGSTEWNKSCTALRGSIVITATLLYDNENHPYVDFQPALRFAPSKEVMLFLRNGKSSQATELVMEYCNNLGYCVDESLADASLRPFRVGRTSMIGRRVKHFSGYSVTVGRGCSGRPTDDGESLMCENERMERRSGYMVASGRTDKETDDDTKPMARKDER